jgi:hypothetical protein
LRGSFLDRIAIKNDDVVDVQRVTICNGLSIFFGTLARYTVTDDRTTPCGSCIIVMTAMRLEKLPQADLNLLIAFAAIAEEKSITAATTRLFLSQPAVEPRPGRCFKTTFSSGLRKASNSHCGVGRFSKSLRDYYPGWRVTPNLFDPARNKIG